MKSNVFRIFVVFIAVVSVSMMGAALATFFVHPDLTAEMNTPAMQNFTFERTTGETPQWTVTRRFAMDPANPAESRNVGTYPTPYQALIKAHEDLKRHLTAQTSPLVTEKQEHDKKAELFAAAQIQDEAAVFTRLNLLQGVEATATQPAIEGIYPRLSKDLQRLSEQLQALSVTSRAIREETAARRTDVLRLQHELEEARTDLFRLSEVRRDLTDRLVRLEIENQGLKDRQIQVKTPYEEVTAK